MKKKRLMFLTLALLITISLILVGCGESEETTTTDQTSTTTSPTSTTTSPTSSPTSTTTSSTSSPTSSPSTTPDQGPQYGGTLKIITCDNLPTYDALVVSEGPVLSSVISPLWDTLITYDKEGVLYPALAESFEINDDATMITFNLRHGVMFHDGTELTSEAVKYHIENFTFLRWLQRLDEITVETPDKYTAILHIDNPHPMFPYTLGAGLWAGISSPTACEKETLEERLEGGSGPFKFVDWVRDVHLKFVKNEDYWQEGKPYLDALEILFYGDRTTAMMAFEAGDAQVIRDLQPREAAELRDKGYNINHTGGSYVVLCPDSLPGSPFSNQLVREAIEYAVDKEALTESFGFGYMTPQYQAAPTDKPYAYVEGLLERRFDVDKARELMAEAGYEDGFDTEIHVQIQDNSDIVTAIQAYLADIGIRAKIVPMEPARFHEVGREGWTNAIKYYYYGYDADWRSAYKSFFGIEAQAHFEAMDKPTEMTDAITEASQITDPERIEELMRTATQILHDQALVIPLWSEDALCAYNDSVHDIDIAVVDIFGWTAADIWLSE